MSTAATLPPSAGLHDGFAAALERTEPAAPAWLQSVRQRARREFRKLGLPTVSDEAFRFTPLRRINSTPYELSAEADSPGSVTTLAGSESVHAALISGKPLLGKAPAGVELRTLGQLMREAPERVAAHLGKLSTAQDGFVAANTALFEDALCVFVSRGRKVEQPLCIRVAAPSARAPRSSVPRILVIAEPHSQITIVEEHEFSGTAPVLVNSVSEIFVGENAAVEQIRVIDGQPSSACFVHGFVSTAQNARYTARDFVFGGALSRVDVYATLAAPGGEATLDGLYAASAEEHVEQHVVVEHCGAHCTSHQKYKGILAGRARGVFDGTIFVRKGSSSTVAHQENRNILLSSDAIVHTKPHLEIDTDDVKCSHGATVGRLDREQVFYLRSRGIGRAQAEALLALAFAQEMTDRVSDPALCARLRRRALAESGLSVAFEELA